MIHNNSRTLTRRSSKKNVRKLSLYASPIACLSPIKEEHSSTSEGLLLSSESTAFSTTPVINAYLTSSQQSNTSNCSLDEQDDSGVFEDFELQEEQTEEDDEYFPLPQKYRKVSNSTTSTEGNLPALIQSHDGFTSPNKRLPSSSFSSAACRQQLQTQATQISCHSAQSDNNSIAMSGDESSRSRRLNWVDRQRKLNPTRQSCRRVLFMGEESDESDTTLEDEPETALPELLKSFKM